MRRIALVLLLFAQPTLAGVAVTDDREVCVADPTVRTQHLWYGDAAALEHFGFRALHNHSQADFDALAALCVAAGGYIEATVPVGSLVCPVLCADGFTEPLKDGAVE